MRYIANNVQWDAESSMPKISINGIDVDLSGLKKEKDFVGIEICGNDRHEELFGNGRFNSEWSFEDGDEIYFNGYNITRKLIEIIQLSNSSASPVISGKVVRGKDAVAIEGDAVGETAYNPHGSAIGGSAYAMNGSAKGGDAYSGDPAFVKEALRLLEKSRSLKLTGTAHGNSSIIMVNDGVLNWDDIPPTSVAHQGAEASSHAIRKFFIEKIEISTDDIKINGETLDISRHPQEKQSKGLIISNSGYQTEYTGCILYWLGVLRESDQVFFNGYNITDVFYQKKFDALTGDRLYSIERNFSKTPKSFSSSISISVNFDRNSEYFGVINSTDQIKRSTGHPDGNDISYGCCLINGSSKGIFLRGGGTKATFIKPSPQPTAVNTHPLYVHRGSDSVEYDYLPKGQTIQCSGSSFVRIREVGENAKIITSGSSCVEIQGNILENVICTLSGNSTINIHGDVHPTVKFILNGSAVLKFDKQPPQSVIDAIVYGSNNKISVPDGFAQHQGASIRRTMNSADAAVIIEKDVIAITGDAVGETLEELGPRVHPQVQGRVTRAVGITEKKQGLISENAKLKIGGRRVKRIEKGSISEIDTEFSGTKMHFHIDKNAKVIKMVKDDITIQIRGSEVDFDGHQILIDGLLFDGSSDSRIIVDQEVVERDCAEVIEEDLSSSTSTHLVSEPKVAASKRKTLEDESSSALKPSYSLFIQEGIITSPAKMGIDIHSNNGDGVLTEPNERQLLLEFDNKLKQILLKIRREAIGDNPKDAWLTASTFFYPESVTSQQKIFIDMCRNIYRDAKYSIFDEDFSGHPESIIPLLSDFQRNVRSRLVACNAVIVIPRSFTWMLLGYFVMLITMGLALLSTSFKDYFFTDPKVTQSIAKLNHVLINERNEENWFNRFESAIHNSLQDEWIRKAHPISTKKRSDSLDAVVGDSSQATRGIEQERFFTGKPSVRLDVHEDEKPENSVAPDSSSSRSNRK